MNANRPKKSARPISAAARPIDRAVGEQEQCEDVRNAGQDVHPEVVPDLGEPAELGAEHDQRRVRLEVERNGVPTIPMASRFAVRLRTLTMRNVASAMLSALNA